MILKPFTEGKLALSESQCELEFKPTSDLSTVPSPYIDGFKKHTEFG